MTDYLARGALPKRVALQLGLATLFVAIWIFVLDAPLPVAVVIGAGLLVSVAARIRSTRMLVRIDGQGITLNVVRPEEPPVHVPWVSVREVVVARSLPPRVGIRLVPGALLPEGLRGLVHDPADPDRIQPALVRDVPGLDQAALVAAVESRGRRVVTTSRM